MSPQILEFMRKLDVKEVHGYRRELGLAVFTPSALNQELTPALEAQAALMSAASAPVNVGVGVDADVDANVDADVVAVVLLDESLSDETRERRGDAFEELTRSVEVGLAEHGHRFRCVEHGCALQGEAPGNRMKRTASRLNLPLPSAMFRAPTRRHVAVGR